jgi:hypothetical protein
MVIRCDGLQRNDQVFQEWIAEGQFQQMSFVPIGLVGKYLEAASAISMRGNSSTIGLGVDLSWDA